MIFSPSQTAVSLNLSPPQISRVLYPRLVHRGEEADVSILQREGGPQEDVQQPVSFSGHFLDYYSLFLENKLSSKASLAINQKAAVVVGGPLGSRSSFASNAVKSGTRR